MWVILYSNFGFLYPFWREQASSEICCYWDFYTVSSVLPPSENSCQKLVEKIMASARNVMLIVLSLMICIYTCITSNTGDFIWMFIIEFFDRENSRSQAFLWLLAMMDLPDPDPVKSCSTEKDKKGSYWRGEATNCFEVVVWDAKLECWWHFFARHSNGRCRQVSCDSENN